MLRRNEHLDRDLTTAVYLEMTHGLDFKTPKFPHQVIYISVYRLEKIIHICKNIDVCAILDQLYYVC